MIKSFDVIELILGFRQGGTESPQLYNLFMNYVIRIYTHQCEEEDIQFNTLKHRIRSTATPREGSILRIFHITEENTPLTGRLCC